jgi:alkanesulfonate monooxygenase SsuD/methylene tetrahydromethanopterin reductase-like flavin-dependent oxidoreductase (luciferase family)
MSGDRRHRRPPCHRQRPDRAVRGDLTVEDALATPFLLIGTAEEMTEQLLGWRERYGFFYITVHEPSMEAFAPVIQRLRSRPTA